VTGVQTCALPIYPSVITELSKCHELYQWGRYIDNLNIVNYLGRYREKTDCRGRRAVAVANLGKE
jgi:hypothetical protein